MSLGAASDPVQNEVGGRHHDDAAGIGVEWVFAGPERFFPHAALTLGHALAVAEGIAGNVSAGLAMVTDHHADVSNWYHSFGDRLDGREPSIDEIGAVREWDVLAATAAACPQECLGILVIVVII